jgi:hypothetical protein
MAGAGAPPRGSDVDFADVFGGPPRRSSGSERVRRSSLDSSASRARSGAEERPVFGDRTSSGSASRARSGAESGLGDRPVFGERTSSERRQLGQEFYRDIFPGGEPMSPRRGGTSGDRDVFGAPASPGPTTPGRLRSRYLALCLATVFFILKSYEQYIWVPIVLINNCRYSHAKKCEILICKL